MASKLAQNFSVSLECKYRATTLLSGEDALSILTSHPHHPTTQCQATEPSKLSFSAHYQHLLCLKQPLLNKGPLSTGYGKGKALLLPPWNLGLLFW